jgi:hypothetical protein
MAGADVPDQPAELGAQGAQSRRWRLNCLAWALRPAIIAARLATRLPQPHAVLGGQAVEALDRGVQQLGIGWTRLPMRRTRLCPLLLRPVP